MKPLISFIFFLHFFLSFFSSAQIIQKKTDAPDFTYQIQTYAHIEKDISNLLKTLDQFFVERELNQIVLPEGFSKTKTSLASINRIYSGDLGKTVVFVKAGVIPSVDLLMKKPIQIENGYLDHIKMSSGLVIAVFVQTINFENASEIFLNLRSKAISFNRTWKRLPGKIELLTQRLLEPALAQEAYHCNSNLLALKNNFDQLATVADSIAADSLLGSPIQYLTSCMMNFRDGVWDGSGGVIVGGLQNVGEFLCDPVESGKKFWESTTKLWGVTQHFFNDFENEARKLYASFDSLPPLIKYQLACHTLGILGGSALLTYLTAGAMSGSVSAQLLLKIRVAITDALKLAKFSRAEKLLKSSASEIVKAKTQLNINLSKIKKGSPTFAQEKNAQVLNELNSLRVNPMPGHRKVGLTDDEIQQLYRQVADHPVASLEIVKKYDKKGEMGFCFGRATTAHYSALRKGLEKSSIRKVWAIGELGYDEQTKWSYHVTTIVRDTKGSWYAIDPALGRVETVEKWYDEVKKMDMQGNMRIFDTEAKRFLPVNADKYSPKNFAKPAYENYFTDLMKSFRDETNELMSTRNVAP